MLTSTQIGRSPLRSFGHPLKPFKAGNTNTQNVTSAEAGFPGKAKNTFFLGLGELATSDSEVDTGIEAKVVGFPGAIDTRPKWIVALKVCSKRGLSKVDINEHTDWVKSGWREKRTHFDQITFSHACTC